MLFLCKRSFLRTPICFRSTLHCTREKIRKHISLSLSISHPHFKCFLLPKLSEDVGRERESLKEKGDGSSEGFMLNFSLTHLFYF